MWWTVRYKIDGGDEDACHHRAKRGSGKTTMAVYLAVCALRRGLRPALLDLDPQETAFTWNERRPSDRKLHAVWTSAAHTGELLAKADAAGFDLAIIDTAPHSSLEAAQVAQ